MSDSSYTLGSTARLNRKVAKPEEATDEQLVTRFRAGDREAFSVLLTRYTPLVFNLTYRFTSNHGEAENLTQETFVRVWSALPRVKLDRSLKPYLARIAINVCRDWARNRMPALADLDSAQGDEAAIDATEDVLEQLAQAELTERVRMAIDRLSPDYRAVITLRYTEELSYDEIAEVLDLPLNTVRTHLRRAKARLREILEGE